MTQRAIVAGVAGPDPDNHVKSRLIEAARCMCNLAPSHAIATQAVPAIRTPALLGAVKAWRAVPPTQGVFLILVGDVEYDADEGAHQFQLADGVGLNATRLAQLVKRSTAGWRAVVIDVPERHAPALRALDWGDCALRAIGPDVVGQLVGLLLSEGLGPVLASHAQFGDSDQPDRVLNVRTANHAGPDPYPVRLVSYLEALREACAQLPADRLPFDEARRRAAEIYVPVGTDAAGDQGSARPVPGEVAPTRKTAHDRLVEHACLFIVGPPGSGKTTFLRRVAALACDSALEHATEPVPGLAVNPLAVLFDLRDLTGPPTAKTLFQQAVTSMPYAGDDARLPPIVVRRALAQGRLVLLLDGLDQVTGPSPRAQAERRQAVARAVTQLAVTMGPTAKIVVTCRTAAAQDAAAPGSPFHTVTLRPFDDDQIVAVADRWLGAPGSAPRGPRLLADLRAHPAAHQLARNPLTLAMVCAVVRRDLLGCLPRDRNDLYDRLIDMHLADGHGSAPAEDVRDRRLWLADLALDWWLAGGDTDPETALSAADCAEVLVTERGLDEDRARAAVAFFDGRAGLLVGRDGAHDDRLLRFAHTAFARFLVACRLVQDRDTGLLAGDTLFEASWRPVVVMYVAEHARSLCVDPSPAWAALRRLLDRAEDPDRGPNERAGAAALAAEAVRDWRDARYAAVPEDLLERLDACQDWFLTEASPAVSVQRRARFWYYVDRHNLVVARGPRWVEIPAGVGWRGTVPNDDLVPGWAFTRELPAEPPTIELTEFCLHAWPVTVAEFRAFVDDGGYRERAWWSRAGWAWRVAEQIAEPAFWPRRDTHGPVVGVSVWEAAAWCRWATHTDRAAHPGWIVRLPTEAQWEYAARGPSDDDAPRRFLWGGSDVPDNRNGGDSKAGLTPPGVFPGGRGPFGAWSQSGNVWEWCRDQLAPYQTPTGPNPFSSPTEANDSRVLRGGAMRSETAHLRVSSRGTGRPQDRHDDIGFRCVSLPPDHH